MKTPLLSDQSALLVIDVQQRLLPAMDEDQRQRCLHATTTLVELATAVGAPVVYTEQYPKGLGPTEPSLLEALEDAEADRVEKTHFNACAAPDFRQHLIDLPKQIVVCGMETHICVYTTVRELIDRRHDIIVPRDAVISRRQEHKDNGLQMMADHGALITNYESLVYDALESSKHPAFKTFAKRIK